ncbi:DUF5676 family membrane protein [Aurantiacibacter gilvus]|uniref:DUF5676 family membrane protein n=1 Tax=Aurantiacibacter gilvus TaxID=3139141 RepID=A0ABU9IF02_9SPHN
MKIDAIRLGLATAIVVGLLWILCSLFVFSMPTGMSQFGGHMMHMDYGHFAWTLSWGGFLYGLLAWSVIAGLTAWAIAAIYNRLLG